MIANKQPKEAPVPVELDGLPRYSVHVRELLAGTEAAIRYKSREAVLREYEVDKWGDVLAKLSPGMAPATLDRVDEMVLGHQTDTVSCEHGRFCLEPLIDAQRRYRRLVAETIQRYLPASGIVEIGAGYGAIILSVGAFLGAARPPLFAGELTTSGLSLIRATSAAEGIPVVAGAADLAAEDVLSFEVPKGTVVFTSFAATYLPVITAAFVEAVKRLEPVAAIHFEPCYEHFDENTVLGTLRRRYIRENDYNRNLLTVLREAEHAGRVRIVEERADVFGLNPLLPASCVAWTP